MPEFLLYLANPRCVKNGLLSLIHFLELSEQPAYVLFVGRFFLLLKSEALYDLVLSFAEQKQDAHCFLVIVCELRVVEVHPEGSLFGGQLVELAARLEDLLA